MIITITIIIIIVIIIISIADYNNHKKDCQIFANKKGATITEINYHFTPFGTPFNYVHKSTTIWEVHLSNGETWYMRTSYFFNNPDWEQK